MDSKDVKDNATAIHCDDTEKDLGHIANQEEHETSRLKAIRKHPLAFVWCLYGVWTVLLVSFENQASGSVLGIPQFRKDFGSKYDGNWVLPANWQSAFNGAPVASQVIGALFSGELADMIGRKYTLAVAFCFSVVAITLEFIATTNPVFFGAKILNGFAVGTIQAVASTYIGEIVPLALRGLMTCLIGLAYTVGPFVVALIMNTTGTFDNRWAYRAIFASQYGFLGVSALLLPFMPESPWWLIGKCKEEKALRSLQRLSHSAASGDDVKYLSNIKLTLEKIRAETEGVTYLECFRKSNLRRTLVSMMPLVMQQFTGIVFAGSYSTYYAQLAGYSDTESFRLQVAQQALSIFGNIISWFLIDRSGRRALSFYGTLGLMAVCWVMGGLAVGGSVGELRGAVAMILVYCWLYNVSIGSTAFVCLTETAAPRLRIKTIALGLVVSYSVAVFWAFVLPYLFNPDKANLGGKVGFIFGGLSVPCVILLWMFQPETKARSYEELDEMFMKKIPARKFGSYQTEAQIESEGAKIALSDA